MFRKMKQQDIRSAMVLLAALLGLGAPRALAEVGKSEGIDFMTQCLAEIPNLRWTKLADRLEIKMNSLALSPKERAEWQADIASIRDVPRLRLAYPKPVDTKNPRRAMKRLNQQENMDLMNEVGALTMKMSEDCGARLPAQKK